MKALRYAAPATVVAIAGVALAQSAAKQRQQAAPPISKV